jgi:hypothetical protein
LGLIEPILSLAKGSFVTRSILVASFSDIA